MILMGSVLLCLPVASAGGRSVGYVDALFTSASATCVTGLVVVDTGTAYSLFGQIVILLLIQAGGLGFMTITTMIFLLLGKKITLKERMIISEAYDAAGLQGMVVLIKRILLVTFVSELAGAALLSTRFIPVYGALKGVYFSVFHAVSAFCNAGFDLIGNFRSFTPFVNDPVVNLTVMSLIVIGGIGFVVILDVARRIRVWKGSKLSLHSKIVLSATAALIVGGAVLFYLLEAGNPKTVGSTELTPAGKLMSAVFQSVTPRTAGFNTISQNSLGVPAKLLTMALMFIGASPGGTGGGIKTSSAAILFLLVLSCIRGKKEVNILEKRIEGNMIRRAIVIFLLSGIAVFLMTFLLNIAENKGGLFTMENILFEVLSAFGTVGLSCGITTQLSVFGKALIMLTMYGGRVGLLTLMLAIASRANGSDSRIRYPEDKILIG